jgi:hypothetical protein
LPRRFLAGPALTEQSVNDHVFRPLREYGRERARLGRRETPELGELRIEVDGGVELDDPEYFRESIHRRRSLAFWRAGQKSGTAGQVI